MPIDWSAELKAEAKRRGHEMVAELCRSVAANGLLDRSSKEKIERSVLRLAYEIGRHESRRKELKVQLESPGAATLALAAPWRTEHRDVCERLEELREELAIGQLALDSLQPVEVRE